METPPPDLMNDLLPLLGVIVGATIAGLLNRRNDAERWRRDWTTERIKELRSFAPTCARSWISSTG